MKTDIENLDFSEVATTIQMTVLRMVHQAKASHVASALSIVDILTFLYNCDLFSLCEDLNIANRDSFILSKGHACTALYATLYVKGLLTKEMLHSYGADGSPLMHHVSHKVPFVDFSSGSLGHGLSVTVGLAKADQINGEKHHRICLLGDGEIAEGANWEAMLFAAHHNLDNVTILIDNNNLQSLDTVDNTLNLYPLKEKLESFGCELHEINGHCFEEIETALLSDSSKGPKAVVLKTIKGKGVSFMENSVRWHYKNPSDDELSLALTELRKVN